MFPSGLIPNNRWGVLGVPGTATADRVINRDALILFVSSQHPLADDGNDGTDPQTPLATIAGALAKVTAGRGDVIYVGPGHTESIATAGGLTINKAGVSIIGTGLGDGRSSLTFITNAAASVLISAANVSLSGLLFKNDIAVQTNVINVAAKDVTIDNCEFREGSAKQFLIGVNLTGTGANVNDRATVQNCVFRSVAAGSNEAIEIGAVHDRISLVGNKIFGDYANAGIHSASVLTNVLIQRNEIRNLRAAKWSIQLTAAATGVILDNRLATDAFATNLDPGSCMCLGNLGVTAVDTAAVTLPLTPGVAVQQPDVILSRVTEALPQTGDKTLFTVAGAPILLKYIFGVITTNIGAVGNLSKLVVGVTDICANLELNNLQANSRLSITGTFGNAMINTLNLVPVAPQATPINVPPANIILHCAGSDGGGGRVRWTLVYQPLEAASTVTAP
jgi:hypothetical protein